MPLYHDLPPGSKNIADALFKRTRVAQLQTVASVERFHPLTQREGRTAMHDENADLTRRYDLIDQMHFPYTDWVVVGSLAEVFTELSLDSLYLIHMGRPPGRSTPTSTASRKARNEALRALGYDA